MMNMMKVLLSLAIMIVLLGGCPIGDTFDNAALYGLYTTVSINEAAAGDFVDVKVEASWGLDGLSRVPDVYLYTELGACFEIRSEKKVGGFCTRVLPLPEGLRLAEGDTLFTDHGKVMLRRGETVDIEHHLRLTADEPAEVVITPVVTIRGTEDGQRGLYTEQQALVKFK